MSMEQQLSMVGKPDPLVCELPNVSAIAADRLAMEALGGLRSLRAPRMAIWPEPADGDPFVLVSPESNSRKVYEHGKQAMVKVLLPNGEIDASGFFITRDGGMVTAAHAVKREQNSILVEHQGAKYTAHIRVIDRQNDVAIMKVEAPVTVPYLQIRSGAPDAGEYLMALGHPQGRPELFASIGRFLGFLSGDERRAVAPYWAGADEVARVAQRVDKGNSGGPLLDGCGRAAGMVVGGNKIHSVAVPGSTILRLLGNR